MRFVPGRFSCTNSPTSCPWRKVVDGYKRNIVSLPKHHIRISLVFATLMRPIVRNTECDPLVFTTPVGATHCFLQHLQFYQNPKTEFRNPRLNSRPLLPTEVDFLKESRRLYDGPNRTGCRDGVPSLPRSIVTDNGEATIHMETLTRTSSDVTLK